ncbi:MAG TPA: class I SAM-dependent methyltransferase [Candidatus Acidoferrales bacterium]|nr:class I SAM-dependent methyltransferase [Candidatus Acidoferrales bacterium]
MSTQDYGWSEAAPHSCGYIAPKIKTLVDSHTPRSVLDLGCGNGELLKILAAPGRTLVGVEYDRGGAEIARRNNPGVRVFNLGVQDDPAPVLAIQPDKFDVVVSTEVIEHLYSPALLPRFAARVLKRGGVLIVSTPYHGYLKNLALSVADKWDDHHTPFWDGGHIKFWSRRTLSELLRREGFEVLAFHGVGRLPYLWKSMILVARLSA